MTTDMMLQTVNRNLVKHAAGRAIFCPQCESILDCTTTVLVFAMSRTLTLCARCWGRGPHCVEIPTVGGGTIEILDGRVLFARQRSRRTRRNA